MKGDRLGTGESSNIALIDFAVFGHPGRRLDV